MRLNITNDKKYSGIREGIYPDSDRILLNLNKIYSFMQINYSGLQYNSRVNPELCERQCVLDVFFVCLLFLYHLELRIKHPIIRTQTICKI